MTANIVPGLPTVALALALTLPAFAAAAHQGGVTAPVSARPHGQPMEQIAARFSERHLCGPRIAGVEFSSARQQPSIAPRLSASATKTLLEARGYTNIGKIKFTITTIGNITFTSLYKVWARDRLGRRVKLFVDPTTARVLKKKIVRPRLSVSAIEIVLRRHGYTKIAKVQLKRGLYTVWARDLFGRPVKLVLDPTTTTILRKTIYQ